MFCRVGVVRCSLNSFTTLLCSVLCRFTLCARCIPGLLNVTCLPTPACCAYLCLFTSLWCAVISCSIVLLFFCQYLLSFIFCRYIRTSWYTRWYRSSWCCTCRYSGAVLYIFSTFYAFLLNTRSLFQIFLCSFAGVRSVHPLICLNRSLFFMPCLYPFVDRSRCVALPALSLSLSIVPHRAFASCVHSYILYIRCSFFCCT